MAEDVLHLADAVSRRGHVAAPTGARRFSQLREILEDLREITDPFAAISE